MPNINKPKPPEISVLVKARPETVLMDRRLGMRGITFGTVESVSKQYGVHFSVTPNGCLIRGTKNLIQKVVEKFHFATVPYVEL